MFSVIKSFTDKNEASTDPNGQKHVYWKGDNYPFKNYVGSTTKARVTELTKGGFITPIETEKEETVDGNDEE